jgi:hypothetical protein
MNYNIHVIDNKFKTNHNSVRGKSYWRKYEAFQQQIPQTYLQMQIICKTMYTCNLAFVT